MNYLESIPKIIGFSAIVMFIINWALTGGYFNIKIHKYDRKINIVTKLMESQVMLSNNSIEEYSKNIIDSSLFGIEYLYDCSGEQLKTMRNMTNNGLTKRGVKIAARLIDLATGKIKNYNFLQYMMMILYILGIVTYAIVTSTIFSKVLESFHIVDYRIEFVSGIAEKNIFAISGDFILYLAFFVFFIYQYSVIIYGRKIIINYDENGNKSNKSPTFINTYVWWFGKN